MSIRSMLTEDGSVFSGSYICLRNALYSPHEVEQHLPVARSIATIEFIIGIFFVNWNYCRGNRKSLKFAI